MTSLVFHWGRFAMLLACLFLFSSYSRYCCCMKYFMQEVEIGIFRLIGIGRFEGLSSHVLSYQGGSSEGETKP